MVSAGLENFQIADLRKKTPVHANDNLIIGLRT